MKGCVVGLVLLFICQGVLLGGGKRRALELNELLLPKTSDTYMEVRHIVLRGSNREIGKALGSIAQEWLGLKPVLYPNRLYAKANKGYLEKNYPIFAERVAGVADAFGMPDNGLMLGALLYDLWPTACSVMFIPGSASANGASFMVRNLDFNPLSYEQAEGKITRSEREHRLYSRSFVMELYPDEGYASIGVGSLNLLSGVVGGMNSKGLVVSMLVDINCPEVKNPLDMMQACGLDGLQFVCLLLDTCATVEEAKIALLTNRMIFSFKGVHYQIGDVSGNSTIAEVDPHTFVWHFTDNGKRPQIMTNHPQYLYPESANFPVSNNPYSSFNRYRTLEAYLKSHKGLHDFSSVERAMSQVEGRGVDMKNLPMRTMWVEYYDLQHKTLSVKFYLGDGPENPETGEPTVRFSQSFRFRLKGE